jgi:hypothetical protein
MILLISTSQVGGITVVSHHAQRPSGIFAQRFVSCLVYLPVHQLRKCSQKESWKHNKKKKKKEKKKKAGLGLSSCAPRLSLKVTALQWLLSNTCKLLYAFCLPVMGG